MTTTKERLKAMKPDELDYGAHRRCVWCGKLHSEKRMLHLDNKFFCGIQHYLLHLNMEKSDDSDSFGSVVVSFPALGGKPDT
jgi:hypothetical protein